MKKVILMILSIMITGSFIYAKDQSYQLPGDVKKGWQVFYSKGCIKCHSIWGEGGKEGPDLGGEPPYPLTQSQIAGIMWNHAPRMWEKIKEKNLQFPTISEQEMADLFSFLYLIRYVDEPGDPARGKRVMESKGCVKCHSLGERKHSIGPDLRKWSSLTNPILWAQLMWNHAPKMAAEMKKINLRWPKFEGREMTDLVAYIRKKGASTEKVFLNPGDAQRGEKLFAEKGCSFCHAIKGKGGKIGPDLGIRHPSARTLGQMAGLMWNHSPAMWEAMREAHIKRPTLEAQEMADIIAYLFTVRYFDEPGDIREGGKIFEEKHCARCHSFGGKEKKSAPDLAELKRELSPIVIATLMWNHGITMLEKMKEMELQWPLFQGKEMIDLIEYLNNRVKREVR